jgi:FAD:protein FMN transferase
VKTARFEAMGCTIEVGGADARSLAAIKALFRRYDFVFSRFRPDSELNLVNRAGGRPVRVSSLFARALEIALRGAAETEGLVEPTLGGALEAAGYDRDFDELGPDPSPPLPAALGSWHSIRAHGSFLRVPAGVRLDLNGVVKALAADDSLALLTGPGFVSAGGDVAARGGLTVGLPAGGTVTLVQGGLATSGSSQRTWIRGGRQMHHLIDPRTGRPADSSWEQATVCGATCLAADLAAKAALLMGSRGPAWLDARGLPGRFLTADRTVHLNVAWRRSLVTAEVTCT